MVVDRVPKRERLMNLVSVLLASPEPVPFREIAGRVIGYDDPAGEEALDKRFDRDKADLRRLGVPIEYVQLDGGAAGYVINHGDVFQQRLTFTPQEHLLLAIAGRVGAAATGGGALEEALKGALRKLAVDFDAAEPIGEFAPITVLRSRAGDPRALENLSVLSQAVTTNRSVRFRYLSLNDQEPQQRDVDPYGLGLSQGAWYLAGFCHTRQALRVFRVSRIEGKVAGIGSESGGAYQVPHDFAIGDHIGKQAWDMGDGQPVSVKLAVAPAVATDSLLPGARMVGVDAGRPVLELEVRRPEALVSWVLARGGDVSVREPAFLRDAVVEEARRLLDRYGSDETEELPTGGRLEQGEAVQ